jgi:hypothetical protein
MADDPGFDALARRYLDLWQGQLSAMSGDRQLTETLARLLATANAGVTSAFDTARRAHERAPSGTRPADGPQAAATASVDGAAELERLRARIDALERRLAELERRPAPKPRQRKPKPAAD